jgi:hypothetical protein
MQRREKIGSPNKIDICTGAILFYLFYDIFDPYHLDPKNILPFQPFKYTATDLSMS